MQLNSNALISLENLKQYLGIPSDDNSKDFILTIYINGISDYIQGVGQSILKTDYIEKLQGTGTQNLILNHRPINTVEYVKVNNNEVDDYEIVSNQGILYRDYGWAMEGSRSPMMHDRVNKTYKTIEVSYNAGYDTIPSDLLMVVLTLIDNIYSMNLDSESKSMKSYKISDVSITWRDEALKLSPELQSTLTKYKGINV